MRRRRRSHRRGKNHAVRNIVISCFMVTLFLATGYSAFQTVISINAKGNIKKYKVNFDPNGGYIDINSKYVGAKYGDLPTPTREGYTFKGWNGKNMFNEDEILLRIPGAIYENEYYIFSPSSAHNLYGGITTGSYIGTESMNISFNTNTKYTLSIYGYTDFHTPANVYQTIFIGFFHTDGTIVRTQLYGPNEKLGQVTSQNEKSVDKISISYGRGVTLVHIKYIQVEEGTEATEYEPYFITKDTKIVQKYEHTLTAVWEENS